jgi:pimeloyl-ACP methyl ester carboxylesterase
MFRRLLLVLVLMLPLPAAAQTLDGDWNGTLETPNGAHLRILFRFSRADSGLQVRFVSVDQAGMSFPGDVKLQDHHLTITMTFGAVYDGTLAADGKAIAGSWTQRGASLPLNLAPGTIAALTLHQPEPGDVTIQTPTGVLAGTILRKGAVGAVIITGSGPANRDGNSTVNGGRGTYRDIAEALAAHDISTLRFDKRGIGESAPAMTREEDLRVQTLADDVKTWAGELKRKIGARCVWLAGHSEGGLLAVMAAQGNPDICGLVLLATPGRPVVQLLREQLVRRLPQDQQPATLAALDDLAAGRPITNLPQPLMGLLRPSVQPYMRSEANIDPAALLAGLKVPVLILQGDADEQVSVVDAQALAKARPDASLKILSGVNHSQRIAATDKPTGPGPLAPGEMDTVAEFMHQHAR